ncbi:hypothetical protein V8G54_004372 [Vigna mungo]|uniref:Uncharacterized protein n=1 Tax=Vigna mungo TaxID=3915 RepID=A0AAQ3PCH4_VIGMU
MSRIAVLSNLFPSSLLHFHSFLTRRLAYALLHDTRKKQLLIVPICNAEKTEKLMARGLASSPQSILSGIGNWSGRSGGSGDGSPNGSSRVPSPTTMLFKPTNDVWDVLYAAVGQVARLRINDENGGVFGGVSPPVVAENAFFVNHGGPQARYPQVRPEHMLKQQCSSVWGSQEKHQPQVQNRVHDLRDFGYDYEAMNCIGRGIAIYSPSFLPRLQSRHKVPDFLPQPLPKGENNRCCFPCLH